MADKWNIILVPSRKWWFPPYRSGNSLLRSIRFYLLQKFIKAKLEKNRPDFIISYFHGDYLNGFATYLKNKYHCKLGLFLHDDKHLLQKKFINKKHLAYDKLLFNASDVIWSVCDELKIPNTSSEKYYVLPPIPSSNIYKKILWDESFKKPVVGFSGTLYPEYEAVFDKLASALKKQNGILIVIGDSYKNSWLDNLRKRTCNVEIVSLFPNNQDAVEFMKKKCSAIFAGYPDALNTMPWIKNSFPSKFVEYSNIKLPIILSSPTNTALHRWATENKWGLFTETYRPTDFDDLILNIIDKSSWIDSSEQVVRAADTVFNSDLIQRKFLQSINNLS